MQSAVIVAVAAAFLAGACTASSREASSGDSATSGTTVTGTDPAEPRATEPNDTELPTSTVVVAEGPAIVDGVANSLIVVHDRDGAADTLASYQADGTEVTSYSTDSDGFIRQPIWSPTAAGSHGRAAPTA